MAFKVNGKVVAGRIKAGPRASARLDAPLYTAGEGILITAGEIRVKVPVIPLTQAEYDALPDAQKEKEALYVLYDAGESGEDVPPSGEGAGVSSFNGRSGAVAPQEGDYTPQMVGALPAGTAIPAKTSDLDNDSGFVTAGVVTAAIQAAVLDSWEASY